MQNSSPDHNDQFNLEVSKLAKNTPKHASENAPKHDHKRNPEFYYQVSSDESKTSLCEPAPILLEPQWKIMGEKKNLGLAIRYQLNSSSKITAPVQLHKVFIVAKYKYKGTPKALQSNNGGQHSDYMQLFYWRVDHLTLTSEPKILRCVIIRGEGDEVPQKGPVEVQWDITPSGDPVFGSGISISRLDEDKDRGEEITDDDPFADDSASTEQKWVDVPVARRLIRTVEFEEVEGKKDKKDN